MGYQAVEVALLEGDDAGLLASNAGGDDDGVRLATLLTVSGQSTTRLISQLCFELEQIRDHFSI